MVRCCLSGLQSLFTLWILCSASCNCFDIGVVWQSGCQHARYIEIHGNTLRCGAMERAACQCRFYIEEDVWKKECAVKISPLWLSWAFDRGRIHSFSHSTLSDNTFLSTQPPFASLRFLLLALFFLVTMKRLTFFIFFLFFIFLWNYSEIMVVRRGCCSCCLICALSEHCFRESKRFDRGSCNFCST